MNRDSTVCSASKLAFIEKQTDPYRSSTIPLTLSRSYNSATVLDESDLSSNQKTGVCPLQGKPLLCNDSSFMWPVSSHCEVLLIFIYHIQSIFFWFFGPRIDFYFNPLIFVSLKLTHSFAIYVSM